MRSSIDNQGPVLSTTPAEHLALDYEALRPQGIELLQRLAGQVWTDYNAHDPGITILVAARERASDVITDVEYDTELFSGIDNMKVELDLVVG